MKQIKTNEAPEAIGPYSQGVKVDATAKLLFVSGQLPIDPHSGKIVSGDIAELTRQVIVNLKSILEAGGSSLDKVVRCDVFLTDLKKDFQAMNEEYAKHFKGHCPPARQTIQVSGLPLGCPIEISCIAVGD